ANDARFHASSGTPLAHDADDRILYSLTTGALYYDADGNGAGAAVRFAMLQGAPTVTAGDLMVV
ncbi:MAG: calcium-binding protein, partial [Rhodocyclaceae bacterium]|nr:calcium-binding protein [Rhodocyclaceae bacterium]